MRIELVDGDPGPELVDGLAEVLIDCVRGGASVGFLSGLSRAEARKWWVSALEDPERLTWVAVRHDGSVVGTVSLTPSPLPNGRHRADVSKLLVRRDARGRGTARTLMEHLEGEARRRRRWLLVLDTETGSPAESVYAGWGWQRVGVIPDYAACPDGTIAPTTVMVRHLTDGAEPQRTTGGDPRA